MKTQTSAFGFLRDVRASRSGFCGNAWPITYAPDKRSATTFTATRRQFIEPPSWPPIRKSKKIDDWRNQAFTTRLDRAALERRKELWLALNKFISQLMDNELA
jgi:hypothetical protein